MTDKYTIDVLPTELADFLDRHVDAEVAVIDTETFQRVEPSLAHPRFGTFRCPPLLTKYGPEPTRKLMHICLAARNEGPQFILIDLGPRKVFASAVHHPGTQAIVFVLHPTSHFGTRASMEEIRSNTIYRAQADSRSAVLWAEPSLASHLGLPDDLTGQTFAELVHPDCLDTATEAWFDTLSHGMASNRVMFRNSNETGLWFQLVTSVDIDNPNVVHMIFIDVTEDVQTSAQLQMHEQEFVGLAETVPLGIFRATGTGEVLYANDKFNEVFELDGDDRIPVDRTTTLDGRPILDAITAALYTSSDVNIDARVATGTRSKVVRLRLRRVFTPAGDPEVVGSAEDITLETELHARLEQEALTDTVSKVGNRRALELDLERRLTQADERFAVLLCDLDGFKQVNDSLGHEAGDEIIAEVGARLKHLATGNDMVARLGGDEFVVLVDQIDDYASAVECAERMLPELRRPFDYRGSQIELSGSIGVAVSKRNSTVLGLLQMADHAMYEAKRSGRNQVRPYQSPDQATALSPLALRRDLRRAIAANRLDLAFQPIFSFDDGLKQARGAESLLRWHHPVIGNVAPSTIIPVAEQSGLINELGDWILNASIQAVSEVNRERTTDDMVTISMNLSALQLARPEFVASVQAALDMHDVTTGEVLFELTETYLVDQVDGARDALHRLHEMGIAIAVDDFGTGFATFEYLLSLPISAVKIDPSFTQHLSTPRGRAMLRGIAAGCRDLDMLVMVEGIETKELLHAARDAGATHAQGYLLGRPVSVGGLGDDKALSSAVDLAA